MIFETPKSFLMPRHSGYGHQTSRDYALPTIPCQVQECPCNVDEKCEMPSCIRIGADGRCKTGVLAMEKK